MLMKLKDETKRRLKLLVVTPDVPRPDRDGAYMRLFALLRMMAKQHCVDLLPFFGPEHPEESLRYQAILREGGVRVLPGHWHFSLEIALGTRMYDAIVFEYWYVAEYGIDLVARYQPWARIIIDSVDIHFRREEGGVSLGISGFDAATVADNKQRELAIYRMADAVVCISDDERRLLETHDGIAPCYTITNVAAERPRTVRPRGPELLYLGNYGHPPNVDGLVWFVRAIWPAIRSAVPAGRLTVIGRNPTTEVMDLAKVEGVDVIGYVPELAPYLERAALMVAPLRFGAGVKNKVTEALAAGLPVVTTQVGAQGLDVTSGEHLMIADEPKEFARRVIELLGDPERAEQIGQCGRSFASALCFPVAIESCLESMLAAAVDRRRRPVIPPRHWLIQSARAHALRARASLGRTYLGWIYRFVFRSGRSVWLGS
jgi:glycosyltransferase involved in cell wall biosynthesis